MTSENFVPFWWLAVILSWSAFVLLRRWQHRRLTRAETILNATGVLFAALIAIGTFMLTPQGQEFLKNSSTGTNIEIINLISTLVQEGAAIIGALFLAQIVSGVFFRVKVIKKFVVTILGDNTVKQGDIMNLNIIIVTKRLKPIFNGFIALTVISPHEKKTRYFDYPRQPMEPERGDLVGSYNETNQLRTSFVIPKDAAPGDYRIIIGLHHKPPYPFLPFKNATAWITNQVLKFTVLPSKNSKIEILQPSKCSLRDIPAINLTALPAKGGIRIRVHNSEATDCRDCVGRVIAGNEEFDLIDYKEYVKNANSHGNGDMTPYTIFDISRNSDKLLFAEIKTDDGRIKVSLDIGKDTIEKEFQLV